MASACNAILLKCAKRCGIGSQSGAGPAARSARAARVQCRDEFIPSPQLHPSALSVSYQCGVSAAGLGPLGGAGRPSAYCRLRGQSFRGMAAVAIARQAAAAVHARALVALARAAL
eukprot:120582-Prymnesium_polylepis.2